MADKTSTIRLTTGNPISVPMGFDELTEKLAMQTPFMAVKDPEGQTHLINVSEIVAITGPE